MTFFFFNDSKQFSDFFIGFRRFISNIQNNQNNVLSLKKNECKKCYIVKYEITF